MSYDKQSIIPILDVQAGFDKTAKEYRQYRSLLTSVDSNKFLRFLPRELKGLRILDIGAGDGRIFEHFKNSGFAEYIALDISQGMLDRFQSSTITKICSDCEEEFPLEDESVDLACMFFLLEYIADITHLFSEIARVLKRNKICVATYSHQRHSFVFGHAEDSFKIERFPHTYEQIETAASNAFLEVDKLPLLDGGKIVGYIYEFKKG